MEWERAASAPVSTAMATTTTIAPPKPSSTPSYSCPASEAPFCIPRGRSSGSTPGFGFGSYWPTWSSRRSSGLSIIPKQVPSPSLSLSNMEYLYLYNITGGGLCLVGDKVEEQESQVRRVLLVFPFYYS